MNIPHNYKNTSIGIIPMEWEVKRIEEVYDFVNTPSFSRDNLTFEKTEKEVMYIHYGDIHSKFKTELLNVANTSIPFLKDEFVDENKLNFLKNGDLVMADASEDYEGIGESIELVEVNNNKIIGGLHTIVLRNKDNKTANGFNTYIFNNQKAKIELKKIATGISVFGISKGNLVNIKIALPPLPEQRRIATLLSTWDKGIETLSALLTQLQNRKKYLAQQLLSGKKRIKDFEGKWNRVSAGDIFKSVSQKGFDNEELLSATQDKGIIPRSMLEARVTMPSGEITGFKLVEKGDFVISLRSFQGGLEYSNYRGLVSPAYTVLKAKKEIDYSFYKEYFKSYDFIGHLAVAVIGIRDGKQISYEDFCFVKIPYPLLAEQTAIANILDSAEREIELVSEQLAQLKAQKKGLMQVLLTGKKRLLVD